MRTCFETIGEMISLNKRLRGQFRSPADESVYVVGSFDDHSKNEYLLLALLSDVLLSLTENKIDSV